MNRSLISYGFAIVGVLALAGCNEKTKTVVQPAAQPQVAVAPMAVAPVVDSLGVRYEVSPAEGIDFKKAGYPNFLAEVVGVSGQESWGRWTDARLAPTAKFRFKQPLPKQLKLEVIAMTFGDNLNRPIVVRIGNKEQTFTVKTNSEPLRSQTLTFDDLDGADTIEIVPPKPTSPNDLDSKNSDVRKLGIGLVSLRIK